MKRWRRPFTAYTIPNLFYLPLGGMSSINVENRSKSRRFLCNNSKTSVLHSPKPLTTLCNRDKISKDRWTLPPISSVDQAKCPTSGASPCKNRGIRGCGGIGRLIGFRFQRASVQVRVLSSAPTKKAPLAGVLSLFVKESQDSNPSECRWPVDICLPPVSTAAKL